jgi:hypothetical protein
MPTYYDSANGNVVTSFSQIDTQPQHPMGHRVITERGEIYRYCKVATNIALASNASSVAVAITYTYDAATGAILTATAAASGASGRIDGALHQAVSGGTTAKYTWVKTAGVVLGHPAAAGVNAGGIYFGVFNASTAVQVVPTTIAASGDQHIRGRSLATRDGNGMAPLLFYPTFD